MVVRVQGGILARRRAGVGLALVSALVVAASIFWFWPTSSSRVLNPWLLEFYPPERNEQIDYQFSGTRSKIFLAEVPPQPSQLVARVLSPAPLPARPLTIGYNQQDVATVFIDATPRVLHLLLPDPDAAQTNGLLVTVAAAGANLPGDSRRLGMLFDAIAVHPLVTNRQSANVVAPVVALLAGLLVLACGALWSASSSVRLRQAVVQRVGWHGLLLAGLGAIYVLVLGYYSILDHRLYRTNTYDLGHLDQTFWLISRGMTPYSSGMELHILGNHGALLMYPIATLFWIAPDVRLLLLAQTLVIALGALPIYLIGRDRKHAWLGLAVAACYLLGPATQNLNMDEFHLDPFAALALLWAIWAVERKRWPLVFVCCLIVLSAKENFALTVMLFGLWVIVLRREWRWGAAITLVGAVWFVVVTQVILPAFNGQGQSIHMIQRYGQYGGSMREIITTVLLHPTRLLSDMLTLDRLVYLWKLAASFGLLALLSPGYALLALPALLMNLASNVVAQNTLLYQYNAFIIAVSAVAALQSAVWLSGRLRVGRVLVPLLLLCGCSYVWLTTQNRIVDTLKAQDERDGSLRIASYNYAVSLVPPGASTAAQSSLQPHLAHRQQSYMFPNPFVETCVFNPGQMPYVANVDYILYDTGHPLSRCASSTDNKALLDELQRRKLFTPVVRIEGLLLLRRSNQPLPPQCFGAGWKDAACGS